MTDNKEDIERKECKTKNAEDNNVKITFSIYIYVFTPYFGKKSTFMNILTPFIFEG